MYNQMYRDRLLNGLEIDEAQEAILFVKAIYIQELENQKYCFCEDCEFFVEKNLNGYSVTGYYETVCDDGNKERTPFNLTVCKKDANWALSTKYVPLDTKTGTNFIVLWILLMIGCTLFGYLSYLLLKAMIGF